MATVVRSVRFPDDLLRELIAEAEGNGEALNVLVVRVLRRWVGGSEGGVVEPVVPRPSFSSGRSKSVVSPAEKVRRAAAMSEATVAVKERSKVSAAAIGPEQVARVETAAGVRKRPPQDVIDKMPGWQRKQFGWE